MAEVIHIGILSAMSQEVGSILEHLETPKEINYGDLTIFSGYLKKSQNSQNNIYISLCWSGWGKVSAARATTRIIAQSEETKPIKLLLFTGVAGAINTELEQWDVIIGSELIQHDMDAQPIFPRFVIPPLNKDKLKTKTSLIEWSSKAIKESLNKGRLKKFKKVESGLIATGDKFINDKNILTELSNAIPNIKAVEMEGAAFAQVAEQEKISWLVIRVISDSADESASQNFNEFLNDYKNHSWCLIKSLLDDIEIIRI
tara:strand:+ start:2394 stop:3167 length:774 start_codon:yes stop_codon:yes gene_type:complete